MPKSKVVYINDVTFEAYNAFLIFELKLSDKPSTVSPRRYSLETLKRYFKDRPFVRKDFATFIAEKKIAGFKNNTINKFILTGKHLGEMFGLEEFKSMTLFPGSPNSWKDTLTWREMDLLATTPSGYHSRNIKPGHTLESMELRDYCVIRLLSETGCRRNEIVTLKWEDIDGKYLTFRDTKSSDNRLVVITEQLRENLFSLPKLGETVFGTDRRDFVNWIINKKVLQTGIKKKSPVSPHLFRHSVISNLALSGANIKLIMELVGHKRLDTTAQYIHNHLIDIENMLKDHSGVWDTAISVNEFLEAFKEIHINPKKAIAVTTRVLTKFPHKVKLRKEGKDYLIKVPEYVFAHTFS